MGPRLRRDDTRGKPTLRPPCYLRRGRAVVLVAPPEKVEGARDAGAHRTHGPVRKRKKHTGRSYRECAETSGIPRAVFEACSATTPEDRRPGRGGQLVILRW